MHKATGTLEAVEPFDFRKSLEFLTGFGPMGGEQEVGSSSVTKALMVGGRTVVFRASGERGPRVGYELFSAEPLPRATEEEVAGRISFFLSLEDRLEEFYSLVRGKDPKFLPVVERAWGLHQVKFLSLEEIVCWALINQRIQRAIALRIKRELIERLGGSLEVEGRVFWAFPDAGRLRAASGKALAEVARNQRIAQRLASFAASADDLDEGFLRTAPYDKAKERLERVRGIGEWSSQFILFRGLGRMGRLQEINVRHLGEAIRGVYGRDRPLEEVNRTYGGWAGYWNLYLWASTMPGFRSP